MIANIVCVSCVDSWEVQDGDLELSCIASSNVNNFLLVVV